MGKEKKKVRGIFSAHRPSSLRRNPAACNVDPLRQTATLLALNLRNVSVASTSAADAILLLAIPAFPILVLFQPLLLVGNGLLNIRLMLALARWCIGRAVLDGGVPVTKVAEVVDIARAK
jgi:membrane protein required for beta-lactamase induction